MQSRRKSVYSGIKVKCKSGVIVKDNNELPGVSSGFFALCVGAILGGLSGLFLGWIIWG